jgi:hypothetical protein
LSSLLGFAATRHFLVGLDAAPKFILRARLVFRIWLAFPLLVPFA